jgi:hypothetical protein
MRLSGLSALSVTVLACQVIFACADTEDRPNEPLGEAGESTSGSAGKSSGGEASGATSGNGGNGANAGTANVAGADNNGGGGSDAAGGMGGADTGMAGMGGADGGMAGMGGADTGTPECTTDANCSDLNLCTDDKCIQGVCQNTNNTANCDDLSSCTPGQDKCNNGTCAGIRDTNLCPACNVPNNIVQNCDFSNGLTNWAESIAFQNAAATQKIVYGRNVIDIAAGGDAIHSVQPRQEPLTLKQGMRYKVRIVAGSSVNRAIAIALTKAAADYKVYSTGDHAAGGFTLQLEPQMKPFEFEFTMVDPDDANVKLEIKMGGAVGNPSVVYLDDVVVEELKCTNDTTCNDGNACTTDVCDVARGTCSLANNTNACAADADPCTLDQCQGGQCTHTFDMVACDCATDAQCEDDNVCTTDHCNAGTCENTNNAVACDDGNACTVGGVCGAGMCGTNVCFDCTAGGNLLTNCDFAGGTTGWVEGFFGGTGTQSVVDGRLTVTITDGGVETWRVQPKQTGLVLVQGQHYVVKFNAMASVARSVDVSLTQDGPPHKSYSNVWPFALTTQMQAFTFDFTMPDPSPTETVRFELNLGGTVQNMTVPNTVTFDNMFIAPAPAPTP